MTSAGCSGYVESPLPHARQCGRLLPSQTFATPNLVFRTRCPGKNRSKRTTIAMETHPRPQPEKSDAEAHRSTKVTRLSTPLCVRASFGTFLFVVDVVMARHEDTLQ